MDNAIEVFETRGFLEQATDKTLLRDLLNRPVSCYIGFDPTAQSLHVGSLLPIMSLVHMQRLGHRPIVVIGGGTALIGDPSGKTEMRPIMTREKIDENAQALKRQLSRFIDFDDGKAIMVNNADWLADLNYIDFLRDIGRNFSVNRMLAAESYRARLETGLNFIEFNYMLLQAYDFWYLFKHHKCVLQMGGNDQWGNILAGADLTRRLEGKTVHGLTFPLLTTSAGIKMGKTHKGAVWLDPDLTSPYDYYQYWINQDDKDVERFLALFTLLPMEDVHRLGRLDGADIRSAKEVLAYKATALCHGIDKADEAQKASRQLFSSTVDNSPGIPESKGTGTPTITLPLEEFDKGIPAYILFEKSKLCKTRGEARRLIAQGGGYINGQRIPTFDHVVHSQHLKEHSLLLRAGKKRYLRIDVE
ncbi:MAG: tyrosine--tRNA ligase [Desulfatiglans sp.]|nr:tyrosine--tRNA ligase [Thermodesulfobacteriota bacterium]MEE4351959.1 tyrosine--tRNA ligase [Desulfatiglans sp.]